MFKTLANNCFLIQFLGSVSNLVVNFVILTSNSLLNRSIYSGKLLSYLSSFHQIFQCVCQVTQSFYLNKKIIKSGS